MLENLVLEIVVLVFTLFVSIIIYVLKMLFARMDKMDKEIELVEKDMRQMKSNYLDRFETAKDDRFEMKTVILETLNRIDKKLDVHIANNIHDVLSSSLKDKG